VIGFSIAAKLQARRVAEQLADGDLIAIGDAGQPLGHRVIEAEFAVILQHQDRSGGELLGDRGDLIRGVAARRRDRLGLFAIGFGQHDLAVAHDRDRCRRHAVARQRVGDDRVDLSGFGGSQILRERWRGDEKQGKRQKAHRRAAPKEMPARYKLPFAARNQRASGTPGMSAMRGA
jgi:hypothetical protein